MTTNDERARILIVDDDPIFRRSMCTLLESDGYVVDTAANAQHAVEALRAAGKPSVPLAMGSQVSAMPLELSALATG